jgi:hypothetical protein
MVKKRSGYVPSMSDAKVAAKTGKGWQAWFQLLDAAGAAKLSHGAIAELLSGRHGVGAWWSQMVTVEYERARGLRAPHQSSSGFGVTISRTIAAPLAALYRAAATPAQRRRWFPEAEFQPSSQTKDKYLRGAWNGGARLEIGFVARGEGKSQIAVGVSKLRSRRDVEGQRATWKKALAALAASLEG